MRVWQGRCIRGVAYWYWPLPNWIRRHARKTGGGFLRAGGADGQMLAATTVAMVLSALVFLVCLRLVPKIPSIVPYFKKTRQS